VTPAESMTTDRAVNGRSARRPSGAFGVRQRFRDGSVRRTSCTTRTASWRIFAERSIRTASGAASPADEITSFTATVASTTG
jgi:hypothetical protein